MCTTLRPAALVLSLLALSACGRDLPGLGKGRATEGLALNPGSFDLYRGQRFNFDVVYDSSAGSRSVLVDPELELSASNAVIRLDASGSGEAVAGGDATINATYRGFVAVGQVHVRNATLNRITVEPNPLSLTVGQTVALKVTGTLSDGSTVDLTAASSGTNYLSAVPAVATVSPGGAVTAAGVGHGIVRVSHQGMAVEVRVEVTGEPQDFERIELTPESASLAFGESLKLKAEGIRPGGARVNLIPGFPLSLQSDAVDIATVQPDGTVSAQRRSGTAQITAKLGNLTDASEIQVRPPDDTLVGLEVTPNPAVVSVGGSVQLRVTGLYLDGSRADLTLGSSGTTYAASSPNFNVGGNGLVRGLSIGGGRVEVQHGGLSARVVVRVLAERQLVFLEVVPSPISLDVGRFVQLTVLAHFSDGSTDDVTAGSVGTTYAPPANGIVAVSANGRVSALAEGQGDIRVRFGGMTVRVPVTVSENGRLAFIEILAPAQVQLNGTALISILAHFSDGTVIDITFDPQLVLSIDDPSILGLLGPNQVAGFNPGTTILRARYQGQGDDARITVTNINDPILFLFFQPSSIQIPVGGGQAVQLMAQHQSGLIEDVTDAPGTNFASMGGISIFTQPGMGLLVVGNVPGSATVTAFFNGFSATLFVDVVNQGMVVALLVLAPSQMLVGSSATFNVIALFSDGSAIDVTNDPQLQLSVMPAIIRISPGSLFARSPGLATLTATYQGVVGTAQISVTTMADPIVAIFFSPPSLNMQVGDRAVIQLLARTQAGTVIDITFDPNVMYSGSGPITGQPVPGGIEIEAQGPGFAQVDATFMNLFASLPIQIGNTMPTVVALQIIAPAVIDLNGGPVAYQVIALFSDGSSSDVTFDPSLMFGVSNPMVLNAAFGVLTPVSPGIVTLSASFMGVNAQVQVQVTGMPQAPQISSLLPNAIEIGSGATFVTIIGSGFTSNTVARLDGAAMTTQFVTNTILIMTVPANRLLVGRIFQVTVSNGSGTSNALPLEIGGQPIVTSYAPDTVIAGSSILVQAVGSGLVNLQFQTTPGLTLSNAVMAPDGTSLSFRLAAAVNAQMIAQVTLTNAFGSTSINFTVVPAMGLPDLVVAANQTIMLSGTNVFGTVTVNTGGRIVGTGNEPLALIASNDMIIRGTIQVNGSDGGPGFTNAAAGGNAGPGGAGGGGGGDGNSTSGGPGGMGAPPGANSAPGVGAGTPAGNGGGGGAGEGGVGGCGPGGGGGGLGGAGGAGGGDGGPGTGGAGGPAAGTGSTFGAGTGGGGGSTCGGNSGGGGGGGGGSLILEVAFGGMILIDGQLSANGGGGGDGFNGTGGAGGGSGGRIQVRAPNGSIVVNDTISAAGGRGGDSDFGHSGGGGGGGTILLDATPSGSVTANLGLLETPGRPGGTSLGMGFSGQPGADGVATVLP